ncbi:MAG TPA: glycosyltransferase family 4 protein [Candidatus Bathyarchaeia archaeon]|nr:glycosyltransferase family 4 protein [Candidatus Bathyarchaeia archaeon]
MTLRILQLISEKPPVKSGFARVIGRLAEELEKLGHEVDMLSAYDCHFKSVGEIKLVLSMENISKRMMGDYDIINVHGHTPTFSDRLLLKPKLFGKKVVYTLHCLVNYYFKPFTTLYNSVFNNILLRRADAVVVSSKSYYDFVHGCSRKYVVPWGVDVDRFSGNRVPHEGYRLLFVGQMRPYKGVKVLLQAVKDIDAQLSIAGDGPDRATYEEYARKLEVENVRFYGAVSDDALRQLYLSSDILVLPSVSLNEAFGLVTLEAAAAGCAVIASDLPGLRDVVKDFGILVKPNDSKSLRDALVTLKDEDVRKKYTSKGLSAVTKYSWRKAAEEYSKIYDDLFSRA